MSTQAEKSFSISRKEASDMLKVSTRTLDRYIKSRKLSSKNIAGRILLNEEEIKDISKSTRPHRNIRHNQPRVKKAVQNEETPDILIESDVDFVSKIENRIYKRLYEESQQENKSFHQRLEGANYRVGQLESQLKASVPLLEHQKVLTGRKQERYNKRILYILLGAILLLQPIWIILTYL